MKNLLLLGASGSIGSQTLDVVKNHQELFNIYGLSVGLNIEVLPKIIRDFQPKHICVGEYSDYQQFLAKYPDIIWHYGDVGLIEMVALLEYDLLVNALLGFVGVKPTLEAIKRGKNVALANKESMVTAGRLINRFKEENNCEIYPIDSEHSAIWQCLNNNDDQIKRIILTASGGSFRDYGRDDLVKVKVQDALKHPTWTMGQKITIDSATMINKCFEIIEALILFNLRFEQISVILHPQSIVHSLVEFNDGALLAQLGHADMRIPIQYALSYPTRLSLDLPLFELSDLKFSKIDYNRYPLLNLAKTVDERGDYMGCIINAADEVAVKGFLHEKISFLKIEEIIFETVEYFKEAKIETYEELENLDKEVRLYSQTWIGD